jgi:hypothetical protein
MPQARQFTQGRTALWLGGVFMGFCDVGGGAAVGEVVSAPIGPGGSPDKRISGVRYEPIEVRGGSGMTPAFLDWLAAALENDDRHDGEVVEFDMVGKAAGGYEFRGAALTAVQFPVLDGSAKETALLTIRLAPEETSRATQSGLAASPVGSKAKAWVASNFRLSISGLEQACAKVNRIEPISVSRALVAEDVGTARVTHAEPMAFDVSNLTFTVAESSAEPFLDWLESFVVKGDNGPDQERTGSIALLAPDLKSSLLDVSLSGLGIIRAAPEPHGTSEAIRRVRVDLYCEQLRVGTPAPAPPKEPEGGEPQPDPGPLRQPAPGGVGPSPIRPVGEPTFPRPIVPPDVLRPGR